MSEEVYTVEQFAERLKLHPKTVLRFIREGRLRAIKVGRSWRILRSDLEAMTGFPRPAAAAAPTDARVTSIVDIPRIDPARAERLASMLTAVRAGREAYVDQVSLNVVHDPGRREAKVVIVASPADSAALLQLIDVWLEA